MTFQVISAHLDRNGATASLGFLQWLGLSGGCVGQRILSGSLIGVPSERRRQCALLANGPATRGGTARSMVARLLDWTRTRLISS